MSLLETLLDLEIAGSIMNETMSEEEVDKINANYQALKASLLPLDQNGELYKHIQHYALNTHDRKGFPAFDLEVVDIFEIEREGEKKRFEPWSDNSNKMLLWHGSRLTNWIGIISQGLRIAPPEAPKTGYRFGKGVYFADMVSKSAHYCFTTPDSPIAVLLLCEVALGKVKELTQDTYMEKPMANSDSTKALGMTIPKPDESTIINNNVIIPFGKPVSVGFKTACTHNEFIVYDVSQITMRYVLMVRIHHLQQKT
eukprot:TRINITY_DN3399_c0_g2_i1.p1 TRINITY_DN3399_c0_g2~~TRINITY_DN3399_c0_g2_i1.p1  ORF type:complete len:284 (-),score=129.72 TRINITY_DN3399_c0_g2_i1:9-773(-)